MDDNKTEIEITSIFKANNMIAESDLLLRFKIREVLNQAQDVDLTDKYVILRDEARLLKNDTLGFDEGKIEL